MTRKTAELLKGTDDLKLRKHLNKQVYDRHQADHGVFPLGHGTVNKDKAVHIFCFRSSGH